MNKGEENEERKFTNYKVIIDSSKLKEELEVGAFYTVPVTSAKYETTYAKDGEEKELKNPYFRCKGFTPEKTEEETYLRQGLSVTGLISSNTFDKNGFKSFSISNGLEEEDKKIISVNTFNEINLKGSYVTLPITNVTTRKGKDEKYYTSVNLSKNINKTMIKENFIQDIETKEESEVDTKNEGITM